MWIEPVPFVKNIILAHIYYWFSKRTVVLFAKSILLWDLEMAWPYTIDERYGGGYLSLSADTYDAPNYVNSTFVLSQSAYAYGNLTDAYILADEDVYSLGSLSTGYYTLDVDE